MKKYFIFTIVVLTLAVLTNAGSVHAARLAPGAGKVPEQEPLQPIPGNSVPNYSNSVDAKAADSVSNPNEPPEKSQDVEHVSKAPECIGPDCVTTVVPENKKTNFYLYFAIITALVLVFVVVGITVYKKKN